MSGALEMMMKGLGIDPAKIKEQIEKAGTDFKEIVQGFEKRFNELEAKIELLLEHHQIKPPEKVAPVVTETPPQIEKGKAS